MLRAAVTCLALAVMLDRIVVSVGLDAITESQLKEEMAVTAFLNHEPVQNTPEQRRAAAHRLVQQTLVARDMELAHFPKAEPAQVDAAMKRIEAAYGDNARFNAELRRYGIDAGTLRAHVENQLTTLRFIEYRFRPERTISEEELQSAYDRRTANWGRDHPGVGKPSFHDTRDALRSELMDQRTDEALDNWLNQTASQVRIVYLDPSLRPEK